MARSPEVVSALLESPSLAHCRENMKNCGCDMQPTWANGAKFLVPLTQEHAQAAGFNFSHYHVIARASDVEHVKSALAVMPCRRRPKMSFEGRFSVARFFRTAAENVCGASSCCFSRSPRSQHGSTETCEANFGPVDVVVECTFVTDSSHGPQSW